VIVQIPAPYVRITKYAEMTGDTVKAIENRIETGVWLEGREYHRSPDRTLRVDIEGVNRWARGERKL
jgi:hypothetical protein